MIVNEYWKPAPEDLYLITYKEHKSTNYYHINWIMYLDWKKDTGQIKDFQYIFFQPEYKFPIRMGSKKFYFLPMTRVEHLNDYIEYQAYSNLSIGYMKLWQKLKHQRPYIHSHSRIISARETKKLIYGLWPREDRWERKKLIKFVGEKYTNDGN